MVDRAELLLAVGRVRAEYSPLDRSLSLVCMGLERFLAAEGRKRVFDKRAYQREYMRRYRSGLVKKRRKRGRK